MSEPALTAEEWGIRDVDWNGGRAYLTRASGFVKLGIETTEDGVFRYVEIDSGGLHPLAALSLYGQPFGFTREDVRELRYAALKVDPGGITGLSTLADRIESLLPPEK